MSGGGGKVRAANLIPDPSSCDTQFDWLLVTELADPFSLFILQPESVNLLWVILNPPGSFYEEVG